MLFELCNDTIDTVCHHLNLASALHLASIAKSILGLGARLRRHADKSAQKIQRAFRRHYSWPLGLRSMAKTLNPAAVAFQAHRAKAAILARFKGLDLDLLEQSETSVHAQAASMQMQTFVTILHEVCEETLPPLPAWKQSAATACVGELIKTLLELGEDVGNLVQNWDDQEVVDGQDELFAHTFPSGDEIMSLRVYLAQMQIWNGWCYRGEEMMSIILDASGLLGCALTFYSLHGWDYTGIDTSSMYQNSGTFASEVEAGEDGDILSEDPDEMLARLSDPKHVNCPLKRGLFQIVREKRNAALAAQSTEEDASELAMQAARYFIEMHTDRC